MATAKPAAKTATISPPAGAAGAQSKSKLWLMVGIAGSVFMLAAGGGAAWYLFGAGNAVPIQSTPGSATTVDARSADSKPPTFLTLEPFTVNLQQENGDHFLQAGIVVQVADSRTVDAMKTYMPIIRNRVLLLLSAKTPSEVASLEGKRKLVGEIIAAARESIPGATPERGIENAYISSFVIQ